MKIITVSREFGSGGRELGKRLSDCLGWPYYDREIISAVARRNALDEGYVELTYAGKAAAGETVSVAPLPISPPCPMTPGSCFRSSAASSGPWPPTGTASLWAATRT